MRDFRYEVDWWTGSSTTLFLVRDLQRVPALPFSVPAHSADHSLLRFRHTRIVVLDSRK